MRLPLIVLAVALASAGCNGPDSRATVSPAPSGVATSPGAASPAPTVEPTHGGTYWAVYLAAGDPDSDLFITRVEMLESRGLPSHGGEAPCDQGSREALGLKESDHVIGVYFDDEGAARGWAATLGFEPAGIVRVKTVCLD